MLAESLRWLSWLAFVIGTIGFWYLLMTRLTPVISRQITPAPSADHPLDGLAAQVADEAVDEDRYAKLHQRIKLILITVVAAEVITFILTFPYALARYGWQG